MEHCGTLPRLFNYNHYYHSQSLVMVKVSWSRGEISLRPATCDATFSLRECSRDVLKTLCRLTQIKGNSINPNFYTDVYQKKKETPINES